MFYGLFAADGLNKIQQVWKTSHLVCRRKFWHITKSQLFHANLSHCSVSAEEFISSRLSWLSFIFKAGDHFSSIFFFLPPLPLNDHLSLSGINLREWNTFCPTDFRDQLLACGGGSFPKPLPDASPARQSPSQRETKRALPLNASPPSLYLSLAECLLLPSCWQWLTRLHREQGCNGEELGEGCCMVSPGSFRLIWAISGLALQRLVNDASRRSRIQRRLKPLTFHRAASMALQTVTGSGFSENERSGERLVRSRLLLRGFWARCPRGSNIHTRASSSLCQDIFFFLWHSLQ